MTVLIVLDPDRFAALKASGDHPGIRVVRVPGGGCAAKVEDGHPLAETPLNPNPHAPNFYTPKGLVIHGYPQFARLRVETAGRTAWVLPHRDGYTIHSAPDSEFRPLSDWIPQQRVDAMERPYLDFKSVPKFPGVVQHATGRSWHDLSEFRERGERIETPQPVEEEKPAEEPKPKKVRAPKKVKAASLAPAVVEAKTESEVEAERRMLQEEYIALDRPMDDPAKLGLMTRIAHANFTLKSYKDAANGYLQVFWENADPQRFTDWQASELSIRDGDAFLAPMFVRHGTATHAVDELIEIENDLSPRAAWLAWTVVAQDDPLSIARARDRILARLMAGNAVSSGMPSFLVESGGASDRTRSRYPQLAEAFLRWHDAQPVPANRPWVRYTLAYGAVKVGNTDLAAELVKEAKKGYSHGDELVCWMHDAFQYQVYAASAQKRPADLPTELQDRIAKFASANSRYIANRAKRFASILEPLQRGRADAASGGKGLRQTLLETFDPAEFARRAEEYLGKQPTMTVMLDVVSLLARGTGEFAVQILRRVPKALTGPGDPLQACELTEESVRLAAHYGETELTKALFGHAGAALKALSGAELWRRAVGLASRAVRGMQKCGLKDLAADFLGKTGKLLGAETISSMNIRQPDDALRLGALAGLADGYGAIGDLARCGEITAAVGKLIPDTRNSLPFDRMTLANAYMMAISHGSEVPERLIGLFAVLPPLDGQSSSREYLSEYHLSAADHLVRAVIGDGTGLSETSRRWVADDEYLIRRRIHKDTRDALERAGVK